MKTRTSHPIRSRRILGTPFQRMCESVLETLDDDAESEEGLDWRSEAESDAEFELRSELRRMTSEELEEFEDACASRECDHRLCDLISAVGRKRAFGMAYDESKKRAELRSIRSSNPLYGRSEEELDNFMNNLEKVGREIRDESAKPRRGLLPR